MTQEHKHVMDMKQRLRLTWKENKLKVYLICITLPIALILNFVVMVWEVVDEEWAKLDSPYDIQKEYYALPWIDKLRTKLLKVGLSDDNILANYLKEKQRQYYELAKSKVPHDDVILDIFLIYKYSPYITLDINNEELNSKLEELFNSLLLKESKINFINNKYKYTAIYRLVLYFLTIKPGANFDYLQNLFIDKISQFLIDKGEQTNQYSYPSLTVDAYLILKTEYISLINNRLKSNYPNWYKTQHGYSCFIPDYIILKKALRQAKECTYKLTQKDIEDKVILGRVSHIRDFGSQVEKFDNEICKYLYTTKP